MRLFFNKAHYFIVYIKEVSSGIFKVIRYVGNNVVQKALTIILFSLFVPFLGCNLINPAEPIPAYLQIDSVSLQVHNGQGSASHKIKETWVFIGDEDKGVFEVPKRIPILGNGVKKITISAGILDNGAAESHAIYPFYYPDTFSLSLVSKQVYNIHPVFKYRPLTKFCFIEDFELGRVFVKLSGDTNMVVTKNSSEVFEGKGSGKIFVDTTHGEYEGVTQFTYSLSNQEPVYIEINYKGDIPFEVGINKPSGDNTLYNWIINPKSEWNKLYLNLTDAIKFFGSGDYRIMIYTILPRGKNEGTIYLDNIKLVTF